MLTTIQGTYSNGVVVLDEQPPTIYSNKVIVTFIDETINKTEPQQPRKAGFAKDYIVYIAPDFDDPINDHLIV